MTKIGEELNHKIIQHKLHVLNQRWSELKHTIPSTLTLHHRWGK
jgi:hypothetical protein